MITWIKSILEKKQWRRQYEELVIEEDRLKRRCSELLVKEFAIAIVEPLCLCVVQARQDPRDTQLLLTSGSDIQRFNTVNRYERMVQKVEEDLRSVRREIMTCKTRLGLS